MKLYMTVAEIDKAVLAFHKKGQTLQSEAHKLACSVLRHLGEHGDIRVVAKFIASMPEMSRANALRAWFEAFGPIAFDKNEPSYAKAKPVKLGEAIEMPFWKFKPEPEYVPLDAAAALEKLIKRLVKDAKETGADHNETIAALKLVPISRKMAEVTVN
jgi:hypothetical protein